MGNCWCLRCFKNHPKKKIVLLILGLDNAGKTATVKGLVGDPRDDLVPTVGFSVYHLKYQKCDIHIYDVGGGPQIRGIWHSYFSDAHGVIFVVDSNDYKRLSEVKRILNELLTNEKLAGKPMLLLANKQDLLSALDELDIVEKLKLEELVNRQRCPTLVKSCSALETNNSKIKTDESIHKGYVWLLNLIIRDYWKLNARVERDLREQHSKNLSIRQEVLERVQKHQINSIEWLNGSGDRQVPVDQSDELTSNSSSSSSRSSLQVYIPHVPLENSISVPSLSETKQFEVKPKRRFSTMRSNKTAPATLLGVSALLSNQKSTVDSSRQLKSAQCSSRYPQPLNPADLNRSTNNDFSYLKDRRGSNGSTNGGVVLPPINLFTVTNNGTSNKTDVKPNTPNGDIHTVVVHHAF